MLYSFNSYYRKTTKFSSFLIWLSIVFSCAQLEVQLYCHWYLGSWSALRTSVYAVAGQEDAGHVPLTTRFVYITYFLEMLAFQISFCHFIIYNNKSQCVEEYQKYPECSSCTLTPSPETDDNIVIL
jgi:hypothetical protein